MDDLRREARERDDACPRRGRRDEAEATLRPSGASRLVFWRIVRGLLAGRGRRAGSWWPGCSAATSSSWPGARCPPHSGAATAFLYLDALLIGYAVALVALDRPDRRRAGDAEVVGGPVRRPAPAAGPAAGAGRGDPAEPAGPRHRRGRLERLAEPDARLPDVPAGCPSAVARRAAGRDGRSGAGQAARAIAREGRAAGAARCAADPGDRRVERRGEPYHPWLSVGQIAAWKLESVFPGRPVDVDMWADGGATIRQMHEAGRPDISPRRHARSTSATTSSPRGSPGMREPGGYYDDDMPLLLLAGGR